MASVASIPYPSSSTTMNHQRAACGGCHNPVDDGNGVVVAFGNSLWHVDCFKCAKCGNRVSPETNLLLLSDGSPVCAACSYNCAVCRKPISHEAIMTGDESYHAACFACKTCGRHIGELVFAKTSQGIYCMSCHNERVARSRRHAEQRKLKKRDGKESKGKLREKLSNMNLRGDSPISPPTTPSLLSSSDSAVSQPATRISTQSLTTTLHDTHQQGESSHHRPLPVIDSTTTFQPSSPFPSPKIKTTYSPSHPSPQNEGGDTLPPAESLDTTGPCRKSFDDGFRLTNGLLAPEAMSSLTRAPSTAERMSLSDKRSSINPGVRLDWIAAGSAADSQLFLSPASTSPAENYPDEAKTPPNLLRDSGERSPSPSSRQQRDTISSAVTDVFYSPPTSPAAPNHSQEQSQTESLLSNDREHPPSERKHSPQDTTWPAIHQHLTLDNHLPNSGSSSLTSPHTSHDNGKASSQQQEPSPPKSRVGTPTKDRPSYLPSADSALATDGSVDLNVHEEPRAEGHVSSSLGLPRMSFLNGDPGFQDLLKLGVRQSDESVEPTENVEDSPNTTKLSIPKPDIPTTTASTLGAPTTDTQRREEDKEAGPSKTPTLTIAAPSAAVSAVIKLSNQFSPLKTVPLRNESLSKKMSIRKPVPKAIVLPDTYEADMALDLDDALNGASSPGSTPGRSDTHAKTLDSAGKPTRRPGSAGVGSSTPPPLSPRSHARRTSGTMSPLSAEPLTPVVRSTPHPSATATDSVLSRTPRPTAVKLDASELVAKRIKEALTDTQESGATSVRFDREFLEVIYTVVQSGREKLHDMHGRFDGMRRASQQYIDGLSVAQEEYDKELVARREAEAEVTRLKIQLSGQAARLTELSAGKRKLDVAEQMSRDMSASLHGLERDLSRLKAERDLTVAEVEELTVAKTSPSQTDVTLQRSLSARFDGLKAQYKREVEPLVQQREALLREIHELKEERNICLEETTALNARNEELAELSARTVRQIEFGTHGAVPQAWSPMQLNIPSTPKAHFLPPVPHGMGYNMSPLSVAAAAAMTLHEERDEPRATPIDKKKWFKPSKDAIKSISEGPPVSEKEALRHNFQQLTILRFARCDHCGDKMWGTQLRCNICNLGCHNRCATQLSLPCVGEPRPHQDYINIASLQPSMFGRSLIEQVRADSSKDHRDVPMIVEKCILAVEQLGMDYEGIYRKSGGSSQSKAITQLFERGDYDAFDLCDAELFNDISSVTSVLKTYFRQLPNPLLTHALHEAFVGAATVREPRGKAEALSSLVYQLPSEHFHTLRYLMLHLYRVQARCAENLMNARNLGVVFGPTLMRSSDLNREYADMAGKALAIEWLIENAPSVFREDS